MKFALVEGVRSEAKRGLSGKCPGCGRPVIAKCGPVKIWHWAHKVERQCASSKPETRWHRGWKERFPDDWQEVALRAPHGELHFADVQTARGWVLEFQHSRIKDEERRSREAFYEQLIWVLDATGKEKLKDRFARAYERVDVTNPDSRVGKEAAEGPLLRTWVLSDAHVFFDFGDDQLWWLSPDSNRRLAFVVPFPLSAFVKIHRLTVLDKAMGFERQARKFAERVAEVDYI